MVRGINICHTEKKIVKYTKIHNADYFYVYTFLC